MKTFLLLTILVGSVFSQERHVEIIPTEPLHWVHIPMSSNQSILRIFVQRDTLKIYTNMTADGAAQLIFDSLRLKYSEKVAKYDSLCQVYNELLLYTDAFYTLARRMYQIALQHRFIDPDSILAESYRHEHFHVHKPCSK